MKARVTQLARPRRRSSTSSSDRLVGARRAVVRVSLGALAAAQAAVGAWAAVLPASFYTRFPAVGHGWVALLPPYNEHLVRDVGTLSLALTVVLAAAAITCWPPLVRTAVTAFLVYAVPHTAFHATHLEGFATGDATAQMAGFALQLVLAVAAGVATARPARTSAQAARRGSGSSDPGPPSTD